MFVSLVNEVKLISVFQKYNTTEAAQVRADILSILASLDLPSQVSVEQMKCEGTWTAGEIDTNLQGFSASKRTLSALFLNKEKLALAVEQFSLAEYIELRRVWISLLPFLTQESRHSVAINEDSRQESLTERTANSLPANLVSHLIESKSSTVAKARLTLSQALKQPTKSVVDNEADLFKAAVAKAKLIKQQTLEQKKPQATITPIFSANGESLRKQG